MTASSQASTGGSWVQQGSYGSSIRGFPLWLQGSVPVGCFWSGHVSIPGEREKKKNVSRLTKLQFKLPLRLFSRSLSASIEHSAISPSVWACVRQFAEQKALNKSSKSASKVHLMYFRVLLFRDMIEREMPNKRFAFAKAQMTSFKNAPLDTPCKFCVSERF